MKWQVCYFILQSVTQGGLKFPLRWSSLSATDYGRDLSTMETTSKMIVSMGAEFYTVSFEVGFSVLSSVLTLPPNLLRVFSQTLPGAKLGQGGALEKSCCHCNICKD